VTDFKQRLISESSDPDTLASLLFEDVEEAEKAISTAQKAFETRSTQLKSLAGSLPSGKYKTAMEKLADGVVEGVKQTGDKADEIDPSSSKAPEQAAGVSESFAQMSKVVKQAIDVNEALMSYLAKQIVKSKLHQGADKDVPMLTILEEADLLKTARDEMLDAIGGVKTETPKPKGFLASVMSAVFGETEEVSKIASEFIKNKEDLIEAALELTPMEIGKFAQAIVNYGKNDDAAANQIDSATQKATDAAGSDKIEGTGDDEEETKEGSEGKGASISKKDILSKAKDVAGDAGELVVARLLKSDFFKDFNITESLHNRTLRILVEKDMSAEDYNALIAAAMEENEDAFKDVDTNSMAKDLNKIFSDNELDFKIEEKPLTWNDLDDQGKRRSQLSFYLDGKFIYGGSPSESTFETLLFSSDRAGYEAEDIKDLEVDVNNTFIDQNGKGAPKLVDIPDFVKLVNKIADGNDDYKKFKLGDEEGGEEEDANVQAAKDETGDYYLVPIENKDRLKDAGFDLEESAKIMKRMRKMAGIL